MNDAGRHPIAIHDPSNSGDLCIPCIPLFCALSNMKLTFYNTDFTYKNYFFWKYMYTDITISAIIRAMYQYEYFMMRSKKTEDRMKFYYFQQDSKQTD